MGFGVAVLLENGIKNVEHSVRTVSIVYSIKKMSFLKTVIKTVLDDQLFTYNVKRYFRKMQCCECFSINFGGNMSAIM